MANTTKSNKGWIFGTALGAVAGAAYALWKTPMSGEELRSKFTPGPATSAAGSSSTQGGGISDKVMSAVEHKLAPIVGVELGKTANGAYANGAGSAAGTTPIAVAGTPKMHTTATTMPSTAATGGSDTLRSSRFAWGEPAPEAANDISRSEIVTEPTPRESAPVAANLPEAAPIAEAAPNSDTTDQTSSWGSSTMRAKRFEWGAPAPDAAVTTEAAVIPPASQVAAAPTTVPAAVEQPANEAPVSNTVSANAATGIPASATGTMHPFPKLGGLEDNA